MPTVEAVEPRAKLELKPTRWRRGDGEYPPALEDLGYPPEQLFGLGDPAMLRPPIVAIVGTRDSTAYGLRITRAIAGSLARAGVSIVSGMARGIDAAAHRAALEVGGRTVAVMGTGIDVPYPTGHRELHQLLSERALVISEYGSGVRAHKGAFPRRNRIIAALAPVTIVIEAGERSGALNTAEWAEDLRRTVAAVPGPIDSPQSVGTNELIRAGATMIAAAAEALALVGVDPAPRAHEVELDKKEVRVWMALADGGLDVDSLSARSNLPARECLAAITSLELLGRVECLITGEVRRR
ncbi:MAG TPA: DNA-processing protein DprA [Gemmatimonadaceae bacterium]|jgi:DNA processing protein